jgi:hypothetical protein
MSDEVSGGSGAPEGVPGRSRRRFLTTVGLGGLTVAAAVFGRSSAAHAANYGCCELWVYPPNRTYDQCLNGGPRRYTWGCAINTSTFCSCCENSYKAGDRVVYTHSAGRCGTV